MPWRRIPHLIEQAYTQAGRGDYASATETMRQVLAIDTEHAESYACLAQFLLWDDKEKAAHVAVRRALELDSDMAFIQRVAGDIFSVMYDFESAETAYNQAIASDPSDADNHNALAAYYWRRGRHKEALELTDKARTTEPENLQTAILRGEIMLELDRTEEAAKEAGSALHQDPENYAACLLMAKTALVRNELAEARDMAVSALMRNPRDDDAFVLLAKIKSRQNPILGMWWRLYLLLRPFRSTWGIVLSLTGLAVFAAVTDHVRRSGGFIGLTTDTSAPEITAYFTAAWSVLLSIAALVLLGHFVTELLVRREIRNIELDKSF